MMVAFNLCVRVFVCVFESESEGFTFCCFATERRTSGM